MSSQGVFCHQPDCLTTVELGWIANHCELCDRHFCAHHLYFMPDRLILCGDCLEVETQKRITP